MKIAECWFKRLVCVVLMLGGYTGYCVITGSLGGSTRFTETTGLAYSIELGDEEAHLSVAVLMRGKTRGWLNRHSDQPPSHFGNGGSIGRHYIIHDRGAGVVWVDDMAYVVAADANLFLFDGGDAEANAPRLLDQLSLETYLGDVPGGAGASDSRRYKDELIKRLEASVRVQAFVSQPLL
jgi:hypothetical protein